MPIYEYECNQGHRTERLFLTFPRVVPQTCRCQCRRLAKKIVSEFGFNLIGYWPGKRIKQVDARKKRQIERMQKKGINLWKMKHFVDAHSSGASPYVDPNKFRPDSSTHYFDDHQEITIDPPKKTSKKRKT